MRPIRLHRRAQDYMRQMPPKRRTQMAHMLKEIAALPDVATHPRVRVLSGSHHGNYRVRVGIYRAIFCLQDDGRGQEEMYVSYVGPRGDAY